jgi:hypothetical protein
VLDISQVTNAMGNPAKRAIYRLWLAAIQLYARSRMRKAEQPDVRIEEIADYDGRFDDLWSRASGELELAFARTSTYLQWRYAAHPEKTYKCLGASISGDLAAYVIFSQVEAQGIQIWEIVEFVVDPSTRDAGLSLLHDMCGRAEREGISQVSTWALPHQSQTINILAAAGLVHTQSHLLPRRFRYTTPFVIRAHPQIALTISPFEADNWYLSMGDSDLH